MQDEINEKVIALSIRTTKLTAEMLQKSIRFMLSQIKKQLDKPVQHHGKQTLKQLMKQNAGVSSMHQLTGDFYTVGEILGHTLKGIGISLGISTNLEAVTAQYVDVRLERKQSVLQTYHKALQPKTTVTGKEAGQETSKKAKKKSSEMEL